MKILECLNCYERYDAATSTAVNSPALYCSANCETESTASLEDGIKLVESLQIPDQNSRSQILRSALPTANVRIPPNIKLNPRASASEFKVEFKPDTATPVQRDLNELFNQPNKNKENE